MSARITEALHCVNHALMVLPLPSDGQGKRAWSSLLEAQKILAALSTELGEAEGPWCQPMNCGKHMPRKFIVRFEDADMRDAVFDDEDEAYEYFRRVNWNWNCYLFGAMPLRPAAPLPEDAHHGR